LAFKDNGIGYATFVAAELVTIYSSHAPPSSLNFLIPAPVRVYDFFGQAHGTVFRALAYGRLFEASRPTIHTSATLVAHGLGTIYSTRAPPSSSCFGLAVSGFPMRLRHSVANLASLD
jgi:hypothetical protein